MKGVKRKLKRQRDKKSFVAKRAKGESDTNKGLASFIAPVESPMYVNKPSRKFKMTKLQTYFFNGSADFSELIIYTPFTKYKSLVMGYP
ncbi:hypothetical protein [Planococcus halocryophilus]|uniref:Uncharacterized protein n=2 Tax=Planococcus halocryophilus TaxID=1215089 RepID=A0A1C7DU22_9BACL|nr:hypothetical protein [Planococcus halocryophilus]ANU15099.1 hypothetical protein BBI08_15085 [Planococcus halocryophilus]